MKKLPKYITSPVSDEKLAIDPKFQQSLRKELFMAKSTKSTSGIGRYFSMKYLVPVGASLAVLALVGGGAFAYSNSQNDQEALREVQLPSDLSGLKPVDEIRQLATIGLVDGVTVSSVELEQEEGVLLYKVKFSNGTFKLYNARTGEMVAKSDLEIDESVPANFVAGVTIESARATAQSVYPNKTITKIELETEDGVVVYSVRFSDDSRVDVSAVDGSVKRTRDEATGERSDDKSNEDSDDSKDSEDHAEEDIEDDGDRSGSNSGKEDNPDSN